MMNAPTQGRAEVREESKSWHLPATIGGLLLLLAVAAWLRIDYLRGANLHVDEFTTLWAAQQVREQGAPIMPSGVLYTRGLLYTYLLAGAETLFGAGRITAFALSMVTGLITIVVTWIVGKRSWSAAVGWLGAVGLALLPEAIIWSSRARFYAQLHVFVLLALWAAWESIRDPAQNRHKTWLWQGAFAFSFICAVYSQEQAILLWPVVLLAMLLWRGWRWLLTAPVLTAQAAVLLAMGARLYIEIAGQPGYFETIQSTRPYLGMILML
jgi:4-amino-4-deoxy-L-arabinose transferase-like glycosyltransferase